MLVLVFCRDVHVRRSSLRQIFYFETARIGKKVVKISFVRLGEMFFYLGLKIVLLSLLHGTISFLVLFLNVSSY